MPDDRLLAIAASCQRVGYVFLCERQVVFWQVSRKAGLSAQSARSVTLELLARLQPTAVVVQSTEGLRSRRRKQVLSAIAATAQQKPLPVLRAVLTKRHRNKYEAAKALAAQYPILQAQCPPKRELHHNKEPHSLVLFAALGLALQYFESDDPLLQFAAAMG